MATAARMAMAPRMSEKTLIMPPRIEGENESNTPISPKPIAMIARINPPAAFTKKLAMAAPNAMSEGRLKCGLVSMLKFKAQVPKRQ